MERRSRLGRICAARHHTRCDERIESKMIFAMSATAMLFAAISVVSALTLAYLMYVEGRRANRSNGMVAFHRHLDALSDDSRAYLRQQLNDSRERQKGVK
jgi:hypothetical protein